MNPAAGARTLSPPNHESQQGIGQFRGRKTGQPLEESQQFFLPGQLHELQHHAHPGVRFLFRRIETRQIQQRMVELRQERPQRRGEVLRQLEEILEIPAQEPVCFREIPAS